MIKKGRVQEIILARQLLENHPVNFDEKTLELSNNIKNGEVDKILFNIIDIQLYLTCIASIYGISEEVVEGVKKITEDSH